MKNIRLFRNCLLATITTIILILTSSCKKEVIQIPVLTTSAVTAITSTTASSGGNITNSGGAAITSRGFCWSTNQNPTTVDSKTTDGTGTGIFASSVSGLTPGAIYYGRAYATNVAGTGYGNQVTITALASLPVMTTTVATAVTGTTATSGGNITSDGGGSIIARGVCWSTNQNPTITDSKTIDGAGTGVFISSIISLTPATTYYLRSYATNSAGTAYGNQITIVSLSVLPTITTTAASAITATTATSGGNITNDGGAAVTVRGVCWSTNQSPTITDSKSANGTGTGTFISSITNLAPGTTYYIRAYATNSVGTAYGNQITAATPAILSVVTTTAISAITESTATGGGNVTSDGGASVISRGVCWSTSQSPTITDSKTINGMGTGSFTSSISGLTPGTTYYFRAYATNSVGTAYGSQLTATTLAILPTVTTVALTSVTSSSALGGGNVTNEGGAAVTARGVCWSTNQSPTITDSKSVNGTGAGAFTSSITSLAPGTTYYVRAYATNSVGTAYGTQTSATTLAVLPTITTTAASAITTTSVSTGGNITNNGGASVTARGVCWSTSQNPTTADGKTINGMDTGSFISLISDLLPGTTYYIRSYATNSVGTAYGSQITAITLTTPPTITTAAITAITSSSATSGGNITSNGGAPITARGVCWSTSQNPTTANPKTTDGTSTGAFTSLITGLAPGTIYYVRAYATNSAGTAYGNQATATTLAILPTLTTNDASELTSSSATCGGNVTNNGGASVTARGVCWSTSQNPTTANPKTIDGAGTGVFTSFITGLATATTYYVRAYATNSIGTAYGAQITATTTAILPTLTTTTLSAVTSSTATGGGNITSDGGASVTARGVCWSTSQNPTTANSTTNDGTGIGVFPSSITGLAPGTTYYVRAYATSSAGTAYGNQVTATTTAILPTLTTTALSAVTSSTATGGGNISSDGGAAVTARGVCWSTTANPTTVNSKTTDGTGTGAFPSSITGLAPSTTYYVRAYATNSIGTAYGTQVTATTASATAILPTLTTTALSAVTSSTATGGGNISSDGGATVTARGVCWSTSPNPTTASTKTTDGTNAGAFTSSITGLAPATTYYVRAYATNSVGTAYGTQVTATTAANLPTLTTTAVTGITTTTASSGGNVTSDGGATVTAKGVCWSTTASPTTASTKTTDGTGTGTFTSSITGLAIGTTYFVRAYATNSAGTSYGQQVTFTSSFIVIEGTSDNIQHIGNTGNFVFRLNSLSNNNVYFVFSNKNTSSSITLPAITGSVVSMQTAKAPIMTKQSDFIESGKPSISDFNNNPWKYPMAGITKSQYQQYLASKPDNYILGTSELFFDETGPSRMSTVRKVITANGKNLFVWVDDLCWGPTSTKQHYVTQEMIDALAPKFLNTGTNDDIYEWVTNICGVPWGVPGFSNLIPDTDDIHIWLTDIDGDNNDTGGTVGYFWSRNNFLKTSQPSSNEKVMFVIDAVMFASPGGATWEMTDFWPQTVVSTLAHEFHHMIYFYQKTVLLYLPDNSSAGTAVNEMLALCVEDLVSNKIQTNGPRGVAYGTATAGTTGNTTGRIPLYNGSNDHSLLDWSSNTSERYLNYSKTYALGAYLMRNYGGANLVKSIVQNGYNGVNSVVNAVNANGGVGITYENILKNFGAANLLSDYTTMTSGYIYNTNNWFTSSINGIDYSLGSINLYNYSPNPYIYSTLPSSQNPGSNVYYLSGTNLTGTKEWSITGLSSDIKLTVIIK